MYCIEALDTGGDLVLTLDGKEMCQLKPVIYQEVNGARQEISGGYVLDGTQVSFEIGEYDTSQPLVIDPILQYATFFGGDGEDPAGNIYFTGVTNSMSSPPGANNFPIVNPWGPDGAIFCGGSQTFNATAAAASQGTYTITVSGTGNVPGIGSATRTTPVNVTVRPPDFSLSPTPSSLTFTKDGGSGPCNISVAPVDGFNGTVTLTHSSTPAGLPITPASATSASPYTPKTFTATSSTPGTYTVTVTGSGTDTWNGSPLTRSTTVTVHVADNTGFRSPTANSAANSSGDGNGTPTNAYSDNGLFAVDTNSGQSTGTACNSQNKSHRFFNYGITIPSGKTITGIQIRLDAKADSTAGTPKMCVQLSWNGGGSWTAAKSTATLTTAELTYILGGVTDTWGRTWTSANLSNASFQVRVDQPEQGFLAGLGRREGPLPVSARSERARGPNQCCRCQCP